MQSVMNASAHFAQAPGINNIQRSVFNRDHGYKTTFDAGYLVPFFLDEVLPGDSMKLRATTFARLSTQLVPIMDNLHCDIHFWYVPMRLLWANWEKFCGAQDNPADSISYLIPTIANVAGGIVAGSIGDYFGLPTATFSAGRTYNVLPFRMYNLIYNQWYRDENLQNSATFRTTDSGDAWADFTLLRRGKRHDYFTSALPNPQKGSSAVTLPLGTTAPVIGNGTPLGLFAPSSVLFNVRMNSGSANLVSSGGVAGSTFDATVSTNSATSGLQADLSTATAATINSIRSAVTLQQFLERDARGGTRYVELILSHFGVTAPDFRLQRPEFLGGGSTRININPVAQSSATGATGTPQGNLASYGTFSHSGVGFNKSFVEHGYIMGIVNVRADLNYQQGLNKMWSRSTRYDFYWPTFAHLGEQSVLNQEIYFQDTSADANVFGYQERYAEYRYKPSLVTGKFRSNASGTLQVYHLAQQFGSLPSLNSTFIQDTPPMSRIKAVTTEPDFTFDSFMDYKCARPMPVYSVPGLSRF